MNSQVFERISIQRVFLVVIISKLLCSVFAWYFNSPWIAGLIAPLTLMIGYIVFGVNKPNREISNERFADSCYYLGFVFTISSIIVSLFDLPNIGTKIEDISIRFGAAMISTVIGLIVRVYLVNFRQDFQDAIKIAEDSLLDSAKTFRMHLELSVDNLRQLEITTAELTKSITQKMEESANNTSLLYAEKYEKLFEEITKSTHEILAKSQQQIELNTSTLGNSFKEYGNNIDKSYQSLEITVNKFSENIDAKLKTITFPDDYFVSTLSPSVTSLAASLSEVSQEMSSVSVDVRNNNKKIGYALSKVAEKTEQASNLIDAFKADISNQLNIADIANSQANIMNELTSLVKLTETLISSAKTIGDENKLLIKEANTQLEKIAESNKKEIDGNLKQTNLMESIVTKIAEGNEYLVEGFKENQDHIAKVTNSINKLATTMPSTDVTL